MQRLKIVLWLVFWGSMSGCAQLEDGGSRTSGSPYYSESNRFPPSIRSARDRCAAYGFEVGTDGFAACVQKEFLESQSPRTSNNPSGHTGYAYGIPISPKPVGCWLYEHDQFSGVTHRLKLGGAVSTMHAFNDKASSARISPGCTLEVYEHTDFRGERRILRQDTPSLGAPWNDRISSARCVC